MDDRTAWLALGAETALDPELAICDPHHHLWIYPDSRYLLDDFMADVRGGHRIASTVHVECAMFYRDDGPAPLRPVGETAHVHAITASTQGTDTRVAAGIVALADLRLGADVEPVLQAHRAASPRLRGVRFGTAWDGSGKLHASHTRPSERLMYEPAFRTALGCVAAADLVFDAWMYFPQLPELADMARDLPALRIVLDHCGGPIGIGPYAGRRDEVFSTWREHMRALAGQPNVMVKLGGLTMSMAGYGWHKRATPPSSTMLAEAMRPWILTCIELFGVERCMFESNFPMDRVSCSYTVLWNAFKRVAGDFSAGERRALFHDNAVRAYAL
jgi:predicted TIM-barrel fold metal-dependent hydrolase